MPIKFLVLGGGGGNLGFWGGAGGRADQNYENDAKISGKKKAYTTTTERNFLGELFLASRINFPGRWWIQSPIKTK